MSRLVKRADYAAPRPQAVTLDECLPPDHLARFIIAVIAQLDLPSFYRRYGARGGVADGAAKRGTARL